MQCICKVTVLVSADDPRLPVDVDVDVDDKWEKIQIEP